MKRTQTEFDKALQESLKGYEFPFDSNSWNALEKQLNRADRISNLSRTSRWLAAAGIVLGLLGLYRVYIGPSGPVAENMFGRLAVKAEINKPAFDSASKSGFVKSESFNQIHIATSSDGHLLNTTARPESPEKATTTNGVNADSKDLKSTESSGNINPVSSTSSAVSDNQPKKGKSTSAELLLLPTKREACVSEVIGFGLNQDFVGTEKFLWNFGDGSFSNQPNPSHKYNQPGTYDVSLSITSTADGVIRSKVMEKLVVVYPKPDAKFDWEYLNKSYEPVKVKLLNKSENGTNSTWFVDDELLGNGISPVAVFDSKGDYGIKLTVVNDYGCSDSRYKYIKVEEDYNLMVSDKVKLGEGFMPKALRHLKRPFTLTILDESGVFIYETKDINKPWDCTLADGRIAPVGSRFKWVVNLTDDSGAEKVYGGNLELIP
jgi:hypothetical protein